MPPLLLKAEDAGAVPSRIFEAAGSSTEEARLSRETLAITPMG